LALKFKNLLKSFLPKGRAWEEQPQIDKLLSGFSDEFGRQYDKDTKFYQDFNIIKSSNLAIEHSQDYLIVQGLYSNRELQRIIVEYLNKDYQYMEAIEDFANFIGVPIAFINFPLPLEFGRMQFGDEFGDPLAEPYTDLYIDLNFSGDITCRDYNKIQWLAKFLKPPYIRLTFTNPPNNAILPFEFGFNQFGDDFGNLIDCELN